MSSRGSFWDKNLAGTRTLARIRLKVNFEAGVSLSSPQLGTP